MGNKIKSEGKKHSVKINTKTEIVDEEIDPNLLLLNPFYNFEDFLMGPGQSPEDKRKPQPNTISPATNPGKITFLDPGFSPLFISDFTPSRSYSEGLGHRQSDLREISFLYGSAEEQLHRMKAIKTTSVRPNRANPVILLRTAQNFFTANSLSQHSRPATRMGLLGVKRKVVPPKSIIRRFGKI